MGVGELEAELVRLMRSLEDGVDLLVELDLTAARAKSAYETAMARALLRSEGANAELRKAAALLMCQPELDSRDVAEIALRAARRRADIVHVQVDSIRSMIVNARHFS
ncbi:MAG: hypothetical protein E4H38_08325 [Gemmatimonadales bacterium]|nr:MAG: hypothetical protein E4H38_08325 [Gemmatimonadales bacterium]